MTRSYRIASLPADGIGPEVMDAGLEVLEAVASRDGISSLWWTTTTGDRIGTQAWRVHAGRRAGLAADGGCDLFRCCRRPEHPGPYLALGVAAADLPGVRSVRQCSPDADPARRDLAAARCRCRRS